MPTFTTFTLSTKRTADLLCEKMRSSAGAVLALRCSTVGVFSIDFMRLFGERYGIYTSM